MNSLRASNYQTEISVIGSGIAGITTAFHLSEKGYKINLIDPNINSKINNIKPQNGSQASLGVLMANSYKKSKGRAFLLRERSIQLWKDWLPKIKHLNSVIKLEKPLIKLANSEKEYQSMIDTIQKKKDYELELLDESSINFWSTIFEKKLIGGLVSYQDGRINPIHLMKLLMQKIEEMNINKIDQEVISIQKDKNKTKRNWIICLKNHKVIKQDYIVICSALNTEKLLNPLGHTIIMEPILGQVVELELEKKTKNWDKWPAVLNYQSINFIHHDPIHILMGATIESGIKPSTSNKEIMLKMNDSAPKWIQTAKTSHEWHGIRARPMKEPSPILKVLEPGLLINTGHYRNGILLAPSCAEWIGLKIDSALKLIT